MDPYDPIAAFYDLEHDNIDDDVALYRQFLYEGSVLEVGTGTGRVAVPLARDGLEVWGVDSSPAMLERARRRAGTLPSLHLIEADVRALHLEQRFNAAIFPLNGIWHLTDSDAQLRALQAVARHLEPAGLLLMDTSNPHSMDDRGGHGLVRLRHRGSAAGEQISAYSAAWDDEAEQVLTLDLWYDRAEEGGIVERRSTRLTLRYLYRYELELLLRLAGFRVEQVYGSYDLDPYQTSSPRLLAVARLA